MLTLLQGDALEMLKTLPAESVDCCVTSPPYFGLRDYGTAEWEGGTVECDHKQREGGHLKDSVHSTRGGANTVQEAQSMTYRDRCAKCGATRIDQQLGLEATPDEYVKRLVGVFREVRRVLKVSGTCFLNLGDSYASGGTGGCSPKSTLNGGKGVGDGEKLRQMNQTARPLAPGLKPKDLIGIPWRVAFALQADGWWLRSDIIWSKPNPMPESVTDRPTKAHEYVFLLTKNERYFYDAVAIAEPSADPIGSASRYGYAFTGTPEGAVVCPGDEQGQRTRPSGMREFSGTRNARTVWTLVGQPVPDAHFAVMPLALAERCIRAGCPPHGTVLDPFAGSGTTLKAAIEMGRKAIGIELNAEYCKLIEQRTTTTIGMF